MSKKLKKIIFGLIIFGLVLCLGIVIKLGKFEKLEGYMYSLAADIRNDATSCDATSCDATSSNATSCDATSSNATSCDATSSNATSCDATSSNATSSNASSIKVTNKVNPTSEQTSKITDVKVTPVVEETDKDLEFNNSEIKQKQIDEIATSKDRNVVINLDENKNISKEIFDAIKGKAIQLTINSGDNQIIFNGKDITESKDIDGTITFNLVSDDELLNEIIQKGVVINFANNGELPGSATIRIKVTNEIKSALKLDNIFVYYYDETNKELIKLNEKAKYIEEGYIEFAISHNSKYVFVNEEIKEQEPTQIEDNEVTFLESHKVYVMVIIISIAVILFVVVILIVDKKTKGKAYKQ